eukprot:m.266042 g.266042  ORF g.266042 m.266042 type:complete len:481 (+) comp30798_c0_seq1:159-1601(+)
MPRGYKCPACTREAADYDQHVREYQRCPVCNECISAESFRATHFIALSRAMDSSPDLCACECDCKNVVPRAELSEHCVTCACGQRVCGQLVGEHADAAPAEDTVCKIFYLERQLAARKEETAAAIAEREAAFARQGQLKRTAETQAKTIAEQQSTIDRLTAAIRERDAAIALLKSEHTHVGSAPTPATPSSVCAATPAAVAHATATPGACGRTGLATHACVGPAAVHSATTAATTRSSGLPKTRGTKRAPGSILTAAARGSESPSKSTRRKIKKATTHRMMENEGDEGDESEYNPGSGTESDSSEDSPDSGAEDDSCSESDGKRPAERQGAAVKFDGKRPAERQGGAAWRGRAVSSMRKHARREPDILAHCKRIIATLFHVDHKAIAEEFYEPVDATEYSDYYQQIARPMDLGTVRDKLYRSKYKTHGDFKADMQLIFQNCREYSPREHPCNEEINTAVDALERLYKSTACDLCPEFFSS